MKPQDKCGVFGAVSRNGFAADIGQMAYMALYSLQHRGHESAGITVSEGGRLTTHKAMGTVDLVFRPQIPRDLYISFIRHTAKKDRDEFLELLETFERTNTRNPLNQLQGFAAIGHTRYSTTGASSQANIHPILFNFNGTEAALAHNGNLTNLDELSDILECRGGYKFAPGATTDTAYITALIETADANSFFDAFCETLTLLKGAFSLVALHNDVLYAAKDKFGVRPLSFGKTDKFFFVASETCALDTLKAQNLCEIEAGVALAVAPNDTYPRFCIWARDPQYRSCVFEAIYLSRPDSLYRGKKRIQVVREMMGAVLAREHPLNEHHIDIVIGIPDSGIASAIGYAREIGIPYRQAFIRPHQAGRTFIEPVKERRKEFQRLKQNVICEIVQGKNVAVVDDSIVRGNTMPYIVSELKKCGVNKVFVLSASPPIKYPCHLGVATPTRKELIAAELDIEQIKEEIGADYLGYLSIEGLYEALQMPKDSFCDGCLTNEYPVPLIKKRLII